jgi:hypothetical protein
VYETGTFAKGRAWDKSKQLAVGIDISTGEFILPASADMVFSGLSELRSLVQNAGGAWSLHCRMLEFWLDARHLRVNGNGVVGVTSLLAMSRDSINPEPTQDKPFFAEVTEDCWQEGRALYALGITKYHLGWIRPFRSQVAKHVRHIREGAWGEIGEDLLKLGNRAVEAWAVHHVLRYKDSGSVILTGLADNIPAEYREWGCLAGFDDFRADYAERYSEDFYVGIMRSVPPELLV